IQIELLKDSKFDSVTTGNTTLNTNGLTIKEGPSITKDGINAGGKKITNVADGINAKDAVNKSQLDNLAAKQNATDDAAVKYDDAKTKDKVTLKGKDGTVLDNVKAGHISSTSKEAVNGSQIHNISNSIKNSIGGNTVVNPDGSLTTNNIGGTGKNNINDAISEVKNTAKKAKTTVTEGDNIVVKETVNKDGSTNYEVSTKKDLTLNSVTTGDSVLNNNGLTIKEGPSITKEGINAGGKKITNVADGINAKDAVNVDQLTKVKDNLNGRITDTNNQLNDAKKDLGNQIADTNKNLNDAKKDLGDQIADTNTKLNNTKDQLTTQINDTKTELNNTIGNTKTELNTKIDSTKTELENKGLNFAGNSGADVHRKLGEKLNIVGGAAASTPVAKTSGENVITRTTKDGIQIELLKDSKFDSVTTGNTTLNTNGLTIKEGPSITKDGINAGGKKITDVANGVIAQNSKDAVNGGQVHHISNSIKNSIGGNTVVNPDGSLTTNNIGGTGKNNINDAIKSVDEKVTNGVNDLTQKGLNFGANDQKTTQGKAVHRKLGDTINIVGGANPETAEDKTSGENIITRTTEDGVKIEMLKDVKFDSVNVGGHVLNQQGLTIKGGPSITVNGINAGGKQITNVADGINAKDAVNKGQLDKQINEVKDQIGKDIGKLSDHAVQYDKDKNGNVDKNSVTLGGGEKGTNLKNVADGKIAEGSKDAVNGGQLWNVQNQVDKNSNDIKNIQNNIDNISNGKAGLVQQQKPNGEITVGKDSGGTSINMAGKEGDRVVQGVKDGEIKAGSNQAVNGGQIHKISESIKNSIGGNTTIDPKDGSITTNNIGGTGKNNINDAIGTLNQSNQELGNKITNLGDQLQQVFYDTNKRIDDVEKKANAGIAAAMALENAPFVAGKYTYAVGAAYHGGENAVGVTLRKTSDNGRWSITGGVAAASQGEPSVRVGISGVIN
ncbi:YadA-like family protein, partial [Acinetobacter baumannii]|nr:YadA-like family protein [Acinetobacter baumannii]MCF4683752.1 YadA-like family protein [Acinetobacter baumannii]MCF4691211.1 YadA-like family protein [Acinetobacter baumannii]MCF4695045.1 YadA-like family protein [Acinetobacter baumannii]MCF4698825.1 YadA-like family protein [Acinetobacter baumannii]